MGELTDGDLQEAVGDAVDLSSLVEGFDGDRQKKTKTVDNLTLNRRRVVWLNHEEVTAARKSREEQKAKLAAEKEENKKKREIAAKLKSALTRAKKITPALPVPAGIQKKKKASFTAKKPAPVAIPSAPVVKQLSTGRLAKMTLRASEYFQ